MRNSNLQLQQNFRNSFSQVSSCKRPVLTHLNADTTWLLQLPYPPDIASLHGRSHFNILIDPWLKGFQVDVASWFSKQWHSTESSVPTIMELDEQLRGIECLIREQTGHASISEKDLQLKNTARSFIDAVVISHEFTDHCHRETLLEVHPDTPVFATKVAADLVRSWKHFTSVRDVPLFSESNLDWLKTSLKPLPGWIGISRIITETDSLYFHAAILITFDLGGRVPNDSQAKGETSEAVIYTPHGIRAQDLRHLTLAKPPLRTLALLHGLHDVTIANLKKLNLGAHNGLRAQRMCNAKFWVSTHDEEKKARGLVAYLLRRRIVTAQEVVKFEKSHSSDEALTAELERANFCDLKSGESLLLS